MYDEILFPTDGSDAANATLAHAIEIAAAFDARIHVLFVVNETYANIGASGSTTLNSLRETGKTVLAETEETISDEGISVTTALREGDPYTEIVEYSNEFCDMIVMGTRGHSGIDKYLLGSVTEKVVRAADVPVVTARADRED